MLRTVLSVCLALLFSAAVFAQKAAHESRG